MDDFTEKMNQNYYMLGYYLSRPSDPYPAANNNSQPAANMVSGLHSEALEALFMNIPSAAPSEVAEPKDPTVNYGGGNQYHNNTGWAPARMAQPAAIGSNTTAVPNTLHTAPLTVPPHTSPHVAHTVQRTLPHSMSLTLVPHTTTLTAPHTMPPRTVPHNTPLGAPHTVPPRTLPHTTPLSAPHTVPPRTVPHTTPHTVPRTLPHTTPLTVPHTAPQTVLQNAPQTMDTWSHNYGFDAARTNQTAAPQIRVKDINSLNKVNLQQISHHPKVAQPNVNNNHLVQNRSAFVPDRLQQTMNTREASHPVAGEDRRFLQPPRYGHQNLSVRNPGAAPGSSLLTQPPAAGHSNIPAVVPGPVSRNSAPFTTPSVVYRKVYSKSVQLAPAAAPTSQQPFIKSEPPSYPSPSPDRAPLVKVEIGQPNEQAALTYPSKRPQADPLPSTSHAPYSPHERQKTYNFENFGSRDTVARPVRSDVSQNGSILSNCLTQAGLPQAKPKAVPFNSATGHIASDANVNSGAAKQQPSAPRADSQPWDHSLRLNVNDIMKNKAITVTRTLNRHTLPFPSSLKVTQNGELPNKTDATAAPMGVVKESPPSCQINQDKFELLKKFLAEGKTRIVKKPNSVQQRPKPAVQKQNVMSNNVIVNGINVPSMNNTVAIKPAAIKMPNSSPVRTRPGPKRFKDSILRIQSSAEPCSAAEVKPEQVEVQGKTEGVVSITAPEEKESNLEVRRETNSTRSLNAIDFNIARKIRTWKCKDTSTCSVCNHTSPTSSFWINIVSGIVMCGECSGASSPSSSRKLKALSNKVKSLSIQNRYIQRSLECHRRQQLVGCHPNHVTDVKDIILDLVNSTQSLNDVLASDSEQSDEEASIPKKRIKKHAIDSKRLKKNASLKKTLWVSKPAKKIKDLRVYVRRLSSTEEGGKFRGRKAKSPKPYDVESDVQFQHDLKKAIRLSLRTVDSERRLSEQPREETS